MEKLCTRCKRAKVYLDYRFCYFCKSKIEKEIEKSNYLTQTEAYARYRPPAMREKTNETRGYDETN